jgi:hypothetical protein
MFVLPRATLLVRPEASGFGDWTGVPEGVDTLLPVSRRDFLCDDLGVILLFSSDLTGVFMSSLARTGDLTTLDLVTSDRGVATEATEGLGEARRCCVASRGVIGDFALARRGKKGLLFVAVLSLAIVTL